MEKPPSQSENDSEISLIDRKDELEELKHYKELVSSGEGKNVFLEGETGIGKTRIAEKFLQICEKEGFKVLKSKCLYYESSEPYLPFYDVLEDELKEKRKEATQMGMGFAMTSPTESSDTGPLSMLGGVEGEESESSETSVTDRRELMFNQISDLLIEISEERPVIFFLDDLQWIDESSAALMQHLARKVPDHKIMLFGAYREDELKYAEEELPLQDILNRMKQEDLVKIIRVSRLDQLSVSEYIADYIGLEEVPDDFSWKLYRESEGNPFYLTEILDALLREGIIEPGSFFWDVEDKISEISVPSSIKEITTRRIEKLDRDQKKVIYFGALIGNEFDFELLEKVVNVDVVALLDIIEDLVEQGIIKEVEHSENELYRFNHSQTRTALIEEMGRSRKRVSHSKIGEALEEFYSDELEDHYYDLSKHFFEGKKYDKAYDYSLKSAEKALVSLDISRAINLYERSLESLRNARDVEERDEKEMDILITLGELHLDLSNTKESKEMFEQLLKKAEKIDDEEKKALALRRLGHVYNNLDKYRKAKEYLDKAFEFAKNLEDKSGLAEALRGLGHLRWRSGEFEPAKEHYQKAIENAKRSGSNKELALNYIELGNVFAQQGEHDRAMQFFEKSIPILQSMNIYDQIARVHNNLGDQYMKKGDWDKAIEHFDKCIENSKKIGNDLFWGWGSFNAAETSVKKGDIEKAKEYMRGVENVMDKLDEKLGLGAVMRVKGMINRAEGDLDKAINYYKKAEEILDPIDVPLNKGETLLELGEVLIEKEDYENAKDNLEKAKNYFESVSAPKKYMYRVEEALDKISG